MNGDESPSKLSKEQKKQRIKDILQQKLNIQNIKDLVIGYRSQSQLEELQQEINLKQKISQDDELDQQLDEPSSRIRFKEVYQFQGLLGQGQYGVVMKINNDRALKVIYKHKLRQDEIDVIRGEGAILKSLKGKSNVPDFKQMFETRSYIFIEMNCIQGGHLKKLLLKNKELSQNKPEQQSPVINEEEASIIMKGIMTGLNNIHEQNYVHRDIKLENIMLQTFDKFTSSDVFLVDFGFSSKYRLNPNFQLDEKIGTLLFMAPEQIKVQNYGKKIDIFASGLVLYYLLVGQHPLYTADDNQQSYKKKISTIEPDKWFFPSYVSNLAKDFIYRLCRISQLERYDAKKALCHPWITRKLDDDIPKFRGEEYNNISLELQLVKAMRVCFFMSLLKNQQQIQEVQYLKFKEHKKTESFIEIQEIDEDEEDKNNSLIKIREEYKELKKRQSSLSKSKGVEIYQQKSKVFGMKKHAISYSPIVKKRFSSKPGQSNLEFKLQIQKAEK